MALLLRGVLLLLICGEERSARGLASTIKILVSSYNFNLRRCNGACPLDDWPFSGTVSLLSHRIQQYQLFFEHAVSKHGPRIKWPLLLGLMFEVRRPRPLPVVCVTTEASLAPLLAPLGCCLVPFWLS